MGSAFTALVFFIRGLCFLLVVASVSLVAVASTPSDGGYTADPFAAYADLLNAEPPDDFVQRGFDCWGEYLAIVGWICTLKPTAGTFAEIRVITYGGSQIRQVTYIPRQNTVTIGDLALLWGKPEIRAASTYTSLSWVKAHTTASAATNDHERFSYFEPVSAITVTLLIAPSS